jgi:peptide/nickel transport system substrate-binding protein
MRAFHWSALIAVLSFVVAGCGGGGGSSNTGASSTASNAALAGLQPQAGKRGGRVTLLSSTDVDYLDPGHTYYTVGYTVLYATQRTLYSVKPGQTESQPDLAAGPPQISPDLKTITVKIRPGVRFSPPVNREVTSKDVKYAFDRAFTANVANPYTTYFADIVGAPKKPGKFQSISGIQTPDDHTLVIKLSRPSGVGVAAALVMPITVPVPEEYAKKFDDKNPSTYNTHVVSTGPYMVKNDAEGNLVGYHANQSIQLVRNPNWDAKTDYKPAYLDSILMRTNASDLDVASRQALQGSHLMTEDPPPAAILKLAVTRYKGQYVTIPAGGFRWLPLNTTIKPFDNLNVRKAVLAVFDRNAVRQARGGPFVGDIATHFIPPGIAGYEQGGAAKGPGYDYLRNPQGDAALATQYMKKAGYPSGKYTGKETFTMVTENVNPGKAQAQVAQAQFAKLGFKVQVRAVSQATMYTGFCQVPDKKLLSCGDAAWFKDFNDPQSMLEPTFKGSAIQPSGGNNNLAQLNDPKIDSAMTKAATLRGDPRLTAWGDIDKMIVGDAAAVPLVWDKTTVLESKDVQGAGDAYTDTFNLAWSSVK